MTVSAARFRDSESSSASAGSSPSSSECQADTAATRIWSRRCASASSVHAECALEPGSLSRLVGTRGSRPNAKALAE
eukprot:5629395-Amphidinium_carterae.1